MRFPTAVPPWVRATGVLLAAAVCSLGAPRPAPAQQTNGNELAGKPVLAVQVDAPIGLAAAVREAVEIRLGMPYAIDDLRRSMQNIYALGSVSDVQVNGEATDEGVILDFVVLPATLVHELRFSGDSPMRTNALRDVLTVTMGDRVSRQLLAEQARRVEDALHDQGYLRAVVEPELELDDGGRTEGTVTFHIDAGTPTRVRDLQISGALGISDTEIRAAFGLTEGAVYRRAALGDGIDQVLRRLASEHFFHATVTLPEAAINQESNTVDVSVEVDAGPRVELNFGGWSRTEEQWHDLLPFFEEASVADWILKQARADIVANLQEQGHWQPLVTYGVRRDDLGRNVVINFSVQPFRRGHVKAIDFIGNAHVPTDTLAGIIGTTPRRMLRGGGFTTRQWQQDRRSILTLYRRMGFLQARIVASDVTYDTELQGLRLITTIDEGQRTISRDVAISIDRDMAAVGVDTVYWAGELELRSGGAYNPDAIRQDETRLRVLLANEGFRRALVTSETIETDDPYARDVRFSLYPGPRVRVGRILISGNRAVKEHVIRRELLLVSGSPLTQEGIIRSQSRLYQLGLFSLVSIGTAQPDSTALEPTIVVRVEEGSSQRLSWGLGYSTEEQVRGLVVVGQDNVWGRNHRVTASVRASFKEQRVRFIYTEPWLLGHRIEGSVVSYFESLDQEGFKQQNYGLSFQAVFRHSQDLTSIARYSFRDQKVFDIEIDPDFIEPLDRSAAVGSVIYSVLNDTRPNPIDPNSGTYHTFDAELASRALASEADFLKIFARSYWYWELAGDAVLVAAGRAGFAVPYRDSSVPLPERFFAGGSTTLRGFGRNQAGPKDPNGNALGGDVLLIGNLEMRFPIRGSLGAALFVDMGNVFADFESISRREIRENIGFGVRYDTPIGPLRLDVARLLDARSGEDSLKLHFAIGQAF